MSKINKNLMVVCSLIAISAISAIFFFRLPVRIVAFGLIFLICPLSHLLMMKFMGYDHEIEHQHENHPKDVINDSAS
jgi:hypothetical protein